MADLKDQCKAILASHLGRELTVNESSQIIPSLRAKMLQMERADPTKFKQTSEYARLRQAASLVAEDLRNDAKAMRRRAVLQVQSVNRNLTKYKDNASRGLYGARSVANMLEQAHMSVKAMRSEYASQIIDSLNAINTKFFGLLEDPESAGKIVKELFNEDSGDAVAKQAADSLRNVFELLRRRYNENGGDIKKLEDFALPQSHDPYKLLKAVDFVEAPGTAKRFARRVSRNIQRKKAPTMQENREAWVNYIAPLLDRSRYVDAETGNPVTGDQYIQMLHGMYDTLVSNGNTDEYGSRVAGRAGGRANRGTKHRTIHFKDAESYLKYEQKFGRYNVMNTIVGHINSMARDIALLEAFGPNPNRTIDTLIRTAESDAEKPSAHGKSYQYADAHGILVVTNREMWNVLNGNADIPAGTGVVADFFQGARNLQVAGKLGGAFISSISDIGTYYVALYTNLRSVLDAPVSIARVFSKDDREFAARAGMLADAANAALCRWGDEYVGSGWTQAAANLTMRLSLLDGWTNGIRSVFALNMMAATGKLAKSKAWNQLDDYDRMLLENNGVTEKDWSVYRLARLEQYKGSDFITRQSIEQISDAELQQAGLTRRDAELATSRLIMHINSEMMYASLDPTLATRTAQSRGAQKGTPSGEFWRSFMLFKSFPFDMMTRHFRRFEMLRNEGHNLGAVAYMASIVSTTTMLGAMSLWATNLLQGKDLQDGTSLKFWGNAMMKGGGLGVFGDMLYNGIFEEGAYGSPNVVNFLGPIAGTAMQTWDVAWSALGEATFDEDTKVGAKALRLVRGNTPFVNIWYVKNVLDHAVLNDLNEFLSPGYLRRQEQRAQRTQGQGYWWHPTEMTPSRMPRMADMPDR